MEQGAECYICAGTDAPLFPSPCSCKDRHVHEACLLQMVACSHRTSCPVCAASLRGLKVVRRRRMRCTWLGAHLVVLAGGSATVLVCAMLLFWCAATADDVVTRSTLVACGGVMLLCCGAALGVLLVFAYRRGVSGLTVLFSAPVTVGYLHHDARDDAPADAAAVVLTSPSPDAAAAAPPAGRT